MKTYFLLLNPENLNKAWSADDRGWVEFNKGSKFKDRIEIGQKMPVLPERSFIMEVLDTY